MKPARRRALVLAGVAVGGAALGAVLPQLLEQRKSGAAALLSASFMDFEGRPHRLTEWSGQVVVCNFWATWCAPCVEEIPVLVRFRQDHRQKGVEVVGIGIDKVDKMQQFAEKFGIPYPLLVGEAGAIEVTKRLGNRAGGLPYTTVLDRSGRVVHQWLGPVRAGELDRVLAGIMG